MLRPLRRERRGWGSELPPRRGMSGWRAQKPLRFSLGSCGRSGHGRAALSLSLSLPPAPPEFVLRGGKCRGAVPHNLPAVSCGCLWPIRPFPARRWVSRSRSWVSRARRSLVPPPAQPRPGGSPQTRPGAPRVGL